MLGAYQFLEYQPKATPTKLAKVVIVGAGGVRVKSALERGVEEIEVVSDSELLVKQMRGEYKVKNETLRELVDDATALADKLKRVTYTAVRREHNELADRLVNEALDSAA